MYKFAEQYTKETGLFAGSLHSAKYVSWLEEKLERSTTGDPELVQMFKDTGNIDHHEINYIKWLEGTVRRLENRGQKLVDALNKKAPAGKILNGTLAAAIIARGNDLKDLTKNIIPANVLSEEDEKMLGTARLVLGGPASVNELANMVIESISKKLEGAVND